MQKPTPELISRDDAYATRKTFFYTGVPCKRGHLSVRYVSTGNCLDCLHRHRENGRTHFDDKSLVVFTPKNLYRPVHWDYETLERATQYLQACLDSWTDAPPKPTDQTQTRRRVYDLMYVHSRNVQSATGQTYELWTPEVSGERAQLLLALSSQVEAERVEMFTADALRVGDWVFTDIGHGPRWYACENIDYALFPVLTAEASNVAQQCYGIDGSISYARMTGAS